MRATPLGIRALRRPPAVAVSTWTPASLPGITNWFEPRAANTFTDLGTTAVSSDTQTVRQMNNLSTGPNLTNAGGTVMPQWFSNSGKPYLILDGANDELESVSQQLTDASGQFWAAISADFIGTGFWASTFSDSLTWLGIDPANSNKPFVYTWDTTPTSSHDNGPAVTIGGGHPVVLIATVSTTAAEVFTDNVTDGSTALTGTRNTGNRSIIVGSYANASNFINMKLYGMVWGQGTLSSSDRASLQTYMAALHP